MTKAKDPAQTARNRLDRVGAARAVLATKVDANRADAKAAARDAKAAGVPVGEIADRLGVTRQAVHAMTTGLDEDRFAKDRPARPDIKRGAVLRLAARNAAARWMWEVSLADRPADEIVAAGHSPFRRDIEQAARAAVREAVGHTEFTFEPIK